jgi:hypothetical protein
LLLPILEIGGAFPIDRDTAAIRYLLKGSTGGARGDIVQQIIAIVRQVSSEPPGPPDPLDDLPGG